MIRSRSDRGLAEPPYTRNRTGSLALCVIQVVDQLYPDSARGVGATDAGIASEPRVLLAIVTYCYAAGVLGSQDIETAMREDRNFRALCHNGFPRWEVIRDFRRRNRQSIERCLAEVLDMLEPDTPAMELVGARLPRQQQTCDERAAELVEQAMFIDLMTDEHS